MTDTPPDWVLIEAAKRSKWHNSLDEARKNIEYGNTCFIALCDMILKHEQPPIDRKLLCAREAERLRLYGDEEFTVEDACLRAIELYLEGFGK